MYEHIRGLLSNFFETFLRFLFKSLFVRDDNNDASLDTKYTRKMKLMLYIFVSYIRRIRELLN